MSQVLGALNMPLAHQLPKIPIKSLLSINVIVGLPSHR